MQSGKTNPVGLVGLGLMGRGIAACLIAHGFSVVSYNRSHEKAHLAREQIDDTLDELIRRKVLTRAKVRGWWRRFSYVHTPAELAPCPFVIESLREDLKVKRELYDQLEAITAPDAVIASNTSSFPVAQLSEGRKHPERFLVMHWAEPAWITRFMEIVRAPHTSDEAVRRAEEIALACDKEPSILNFDIRGFITNRLMYAFIREACYLVDIGAATPEMVDRSFRNDVGWWAALAGPFRWMDLTGIHSYGAVMEGLLPELSNRKELPKIMQEMMKKGAKGTANRTGFYPYDEKSAKAWEEVWVDFTYDIRNLVKKHEKSLQARSKRRAH